MLDCRFGCFAKRLLGLGRFLDVDVLSGLQLALELRALGGTRFLLACDCCRSSCICRSLALLNETIKGGRVELSTECLLQHLDGHILRFRKFVFLRLFRLSSFVHFVRRSAEVNTPLLLTELAGLFCASGGLSAGVLLSNRRAFHL